MEQVKFIWTLRKELGLKNRDISVHLSVPISQISKMVKCFESGQFIVR